MPKRKAEGDQSATKMVKKIKADLGMKKSTKMAKFIRNDRFGVKLQMGPEIKNVDTNFLDVQPSSTGAVTLLNGMTQGTTTVTRIGQKIEMTSCQIKGLYYNNITDLGNISGTPGCDLLQCSLVYDKQSNGAAPSWSDIFTDSTAINAPTGARNVNNLDRFVVLKTFHVLISQAGPNAEYFEHYIPMNHDVRYNTGTAGTVADIQTGALYLAYSNSNPIASVATSGMIVSNVRVSFKDE